MPYVNVRGQKIFYEEHGKGFPVLFGHSYLWDAGMWEPQIAELSKTYRCIVPEIRSHGQSDALPETTYSIEAIAEDHRAIVNALGLEHIAVVGLSVGGMWGTRLALDYPETVKALVLMDTFTGPEPLESRNRYFGMLDMVEQAGAIPASLTDSITPLFFSPETFKNNPVLVNKFKESLLSIPPDRIPGIVAIGRAIFSRASMLENSGDIKIPVLIVVGSDDRSRPPHEARVMAETIQNARMEIIPNAGHISNLEQPDHVTALLSAFLQEAL
ncbi:MAG: 2-succinyl-6-hydroxy-2,4-cyclohexadiene-1-carboxylate synthase [bacterium]|nr:MAG: 2-succinyl-6-hydroxy-2,4-cyclohexadiene-1-carboxylate synthase [bacterium]